MVAFDAHDARIKKPRCGKRIQIDRVTPRTDHGRHKIFPESVIAVADPLLSERLRVAMRVDIMFQTTEE